MRAAWRTAARMLACRILSGAALNPPHAQACAVHVVLPQHGMDGIAGGSPAESCTALTAVAWLQVLRHCVAAAAAPFLAEQAHQLAAEFQQFVSSGMTVAAHDGSVFGQVEGQASPAGTLHAHAAGMRSPAVFESPPRMSLLGTHCFVAVRRPLCAAAGRLAYCRPCIERQWNASPARAGMDRLTPDSAISGDVLMCSCCAGLSGAFAVIARQDSNDSEWMSSQAGVKAAIKCELASGLVLSHSHAHLDPVNQQIWGDMAVMWQMGSPLSPISDCETRKGIA